MENIKKYVEILDLCNGVHNKKDVRGWNTLYEFDNTSSNKDFDARVYKQGNHIVLAFAGSDMARINDLKNDVHIMLTPQKIPSQYGDAERLYNLVRSKYPNATIEFTGYSLGASIANLLSHRTGLASYALAPVGSKNIARAYPDYFKYDDSKITTYGRMGDFLFNQNLKYNNQSGKIIILPDLDKNERGKNLPVAENHYLHNFKSYQFYQAKLYQQNNFTKGQPTGYAVSLESEHIFTPSEIGQMSPDEFSQNEAAIMQQMENGLIQDNEPQTDYSGYTNPITGSGQIFTREDIGSMTLDEYSQNENAINAQLNTIGVPANQELEMATHSGGVIYVRPYVRSDGTPVRGYYRSN